jgi:hypothetical protein
MFPDGDSSRQHLDVGYARISERPFQPRLGGDERTEWAISRRGRSIAYASLKPRVGTRWRGRLRLIGVFWQVLVLLAVLATAGVGLSLTARRSMKRRAVERQHQRELISRANYEDELWAHGDDHGIYGEYPPDHQGRVPELRNRSAAAGRPDPLAGPRRPTSRLQRPVQDEPTDGPGEFERRVAINREKVSQRREEANRAASQHDMQIAQEAATGRALMDQFVALMQRYSVPAETVYKERKGPNSITYDTVVGEGWNIGAGGKISAAALEGFRPFVAGRQPSYATYFLPGIGIAKVVHTQPDRRMINVLLYPTEPDNSDQAYRAWASRANELSSQAQSLIDGEA